MRTNGFSFSVKRRDLDKLIRNIIPSSFKKAVQELQNQLERQNLPTHCLSHSSGGNAIHIRFVSLATDKPIAVIAIEFTRQTLSDIELQKDFDRYYKPYGARDFKILNPRKHASEQI